MTLFEIDQPRSLSSRPARWPDWARPANRPAHGCIDLRQDWPAALLEAGLDKGGDRVDRRGALRISAAGGSGRVAGNITRSVREAAGSPARPSGRPEIDKERARETMRKASVKWREHGLELDFTELGFQGERNDVAAICRTWDGGRSVPR